MVLRALELGDMEILRSFHNDPEIGNLVGGWSFPISSYEQMKWYENTIADQKNHRFAIETKEDGFIGITTLTNIDLKNRSAENGMIIGKKDLRGLGYGRDTLMSIMKFAFEELQLNRLDADIAEHNTPSLKLYTEKCGWIEEGRIRQHIYRNNRYYDRVVIGILKEEYEELCKDNKYWNS